jgi:hypothetical protein
MTFQPSILAPFIAIALALLALWDAKRMVRKYDRDVEANKKAMIANALAQHGNQSSPTPRPEMSTHTSFIVSDDAFTGFAHH